MFERFAQTRAILAARKNSKIKRFVGSSIAANGPMFESLVKNVGRHNDITLVIDSMLKQPIKLGTRMPKNLLLFAREVAATWDSFSPEERAEAGLDPELCRNISPASTFFSGIRRGSNSLAAILDNAENKRSMIRRWNLLMGLQHGSIPFEKVQEFFLNEAKECIKLTSFEITDQRIRLSGLRAKIDEETGEISPIPGEITLVHNNVYSSIAEYGEMLAALKTAAANRLIVGYSPLVH